MPSSWQFSVSICNVLDQADLPDWVYAAGGLWNGLVLRARLQTGVAGTYPYIMDFSEARLNPASAQKREAVECGNGRTGHDPNCRKQYPESKETASNVHPCAPPAALQARCLIFLVGAPGRQSSTRRWATAAAAPSPHPTARLAAHARRLRR